MLVEGAQGTISKPNEHPKVVATILAYQNPQGLARVVDSIRDQSHTVATVVVVDNGQQHQATHPTQTKAQGPDIVVVTPRENVGVGAGHNIAIKRALREQPDYVWVLEHDTLPDPHCLESLLRVFAEASESRVGAVIPDLSRNRYERDLGVLRSPHRVTETDRFTFNAPLFSAEALHEAGNLREDLFVGQEDWEYSSQLREHGWTLLSLNEALGIHPNRGGGRFPVIPSPMRHYYATRNQFLISSSRSKYRIFLAQLIAVPADVVSYRSVALAHARLRGAVDGSRGLCGRTF